MELSKLQDTRPTKATVDLGGGAQINLIYDRAIITAEWLDQKSTRAERLSELLISWDVTQDGKPYQPDLSLNGERPAIWRDLLQAIPPDVLKAVEDGIWDNYYAGKPLGGGSSTG